MDGNINVVVTADQSVAVERVEGAVLLVGCDGGGSPVQEQLNVSGELQQKLNFLEWGYKEVPFPAAPDGKYRMPENALHIWPRGDHFLMGLANPDGSFTGTIYVDNEEQQPDGSLLKDLPPPGDDFHKCGETRRNAGPPYSQPTRTWQLRTPSGSSTTRMPSRSLAARRAFVSTAGIP